jgi:hypothetical protein
MKILCVCLRRVNLHRTHTSFSFSSSNWSAFGDRWRWMNIRFMLLHHMACCCFILSEDKNKHRIVEENVFSFVNYMLMSFIYATISSQIHICIHTFTHATLLWTVAIAYDGKRIIFFVTSDNINRNKKRKNVLEWMENKLNVSLINWIIIMNHDNAFHSDSHFYLCFDAFSTQSKTHSHTLVQVTNSLSE